MVDYSKFDDISDDDEIEDASFSNYEHADDSKKHKLMAHHRKKIEDILKAAKNGRIPALKEAVAAYTEEIAEEDEDITEAEVICGMKDGPGRTAIHFAASRGKEKTCKYLLGLVGERGLSLQDENGCEPLAMACDKKGKLPTVKLLLEMKVIQYVHTLRANEAN